RTGTTVAGTGQYDIAFLQHTVLHQQGSHRTATFIQTRFHHHTLTRAGEMRFQLENFSLQQHRFQQIVNTRTGFGRHTDKRNLTTPVFRHHVTGGQFVFHAINIDGVFVDLGHRHHNGYTGRLRVLDGFDGLRHDAVVRRYHQNDYVSSLRTTGTHGGKRSVAGSIQEGHHAMTGFHMVRTDVLGNTTGFAGCHAGTTDVVEQRSFTMVNVTHYGHHRRA